MNSPESLSFGHSETPGSPENPATSSQPEAPQAPFEPEVGEQVEDAGKIEKLTEEESITLNWALVKDLEKFDLKNQEKTQTLIREHSKAVDRYTSYKNKAINPL